MHSRKISVIGLGYVGLPVAVAFAKDQSVIGFDINNRRIDELKDKIAPTDFDAEIKGVKSGWFASLIGVGTATM